MGDVVAVLLDDAMPPARLGELLREARKRRGWKRKHAAAKAGVMPEQLRAYERGTAPVPAEVCARLADVYGADLTEHVPMRVPVRANEDWLVVGEYEQPLMSGTLDEIVAGYVKLVHRLRSSKPGTALTLRGDDLNVLAVALGHDRDEIEARIADVLGCSRAEARALHNEMLRRKVILPVAGFAAGLAAIGGMVHASTTASAEANAPHPVAHVTSSPGGHHAPAPPVAPTTTPPTTAVVVQTPAAVVPATPPQHTTDATVPVAEKPADVPEQITPVPDPNDPPVDVPVSVLPGEQPIMIIGTPDTTHS